jgi:hypothetical protein
MHTPLFCWHLPQNELFQLEVFVLIQIKILSILGYVYYPSKFQYIVGGASHVRLKYKNKDDMTWTLD